MNVPVAGLRELPAVDLKELPKYISTEAVGWVMACHYEVEGYWVSPTAVTRVGPASTSISPGTGVRVVQPTVPMSAQPGASRADEEASPVHLEELFSRTRDQRLEYLADVGMDDGQINALVQLVAEWLDEDEIARLESLSRSVVEEGLRAVDLFRRWVNWVCQIRLALALSHEDCPFSDFNLAASYALSHASTLVSASYRADRVGMSPIPALVPGDELG